METLSTLTAEVKSALEHVISISSAEKEGRSDKHKKGGQVAEVLGKSLRNVSTGKSLTNRNTGNCIHDE